MKNKRKKLQITETGMKQNWSHDFGTLMCFNFFVNNKAEINKHLNKDYKIRLK